MNQRADVAGSCWTHLQPIHVSEYGEQRESNRCVEITFRFLKVNKGPSVKTFLVNVWIIQQFAIVVGPEMKLTRVRLPKDMAAELLKPMHHSD